MGAWGGAAVLVELGSLVPDVTLGVWSTIRDVMIIVVSILGTLFFAVLIVSLTLIFFSVKGLVGDVKALINDEVKPTLEAVKGSANSIKGAATVAASVGAAAAGGNAGKAVGLAMGARRVLGMVRGRSKK